MLLESTNLDLQGHDYLEVHALDVGHVHVVGRWADIFVLLVGEDVDADHVDLGVAVLASLGGRHFDNLAGATLKYQEFWITHQITRYARKLMHFEENLKLKF